MPRLAALEPIARIGRYDVIGRLASGGMAEIFLARESGPHTVGRHVVLKRILPHMTDDERMVEMFVHEAKLCMNLSHPHICPIYEFGDDDGRFFLSMEWVRGVSVRELIDRVGALPVPLVAQVFADVAGALHHAHTCTDQAGKPLAIVHRDVNPENVMIGFDGVTKLLDFGVAAAATERKHKTEAGNLKGKFAYISPEQYQGLALDGRSDVFSLGVSLYEALTGKSLYERASEYETVAAIVLDPDVPSVREARSDVPEELDRIVQRALAKDRDQRYRNADQLQSDLDAFNARAGYRLRPSDITEALERLVPDLIAAEPTLDRRPPTVSSKTPSKAELEVDERPSGSAELRAMALGIEADEDAEELLGQRRRGGRVLTLVAALVIVVSIGVVAWVVTRPRPQPAPTPTPTSAPANP